jgi:hypothetical protein
MAFPDPGAFVVTNLAKHPAWRWADRADKSLVWETVRRSALAAWPAHDHNVTLVWNGQGQ